MKNKNNVSFNSTSFLYGFVYFFFIALQYLKFQQLNITYLGEEITFNIYPYYTVLFVSVPVIFLFFLYVPLLFIVKLDVRPRLNIIYFGDNLLTKVCYIIKDNTLYNKFDKQYSILRC